MNWHQNIQFVFSITVTHTVVTIPSIHFPLFTTIHSVTQLYVQIIHILVHKLFPCFPGPTSLSGSLNLQTNTFSPNHSQPFLNHIHTIAIYLLYQSIYCITFAVSPILNHFRLVSEIHSHQRLHLASSINVVVPATRQFHLATMHVRSQELGHGIRYRSASPPHHPSLHFTKTELLWVGSEHNLASLRGCTPSLQLGEDVIRARDHVRLLDVTVAADPSLDKHVSSVCKTCFTCLSLIRHRVAEDTSSRLCYIARGLLQLSPRLVAEDDH